MPHFTLIYDTYCGWCYGATPILISLAQSGAKVKALHRYLFQGANAHKMSDGFGHYAEQIDQRIAQLTGQPFSDAYVQRLLHSETEVLESALTARAAAMVRHQGFATEITLAKKLQTARYVEGISASDLSPIIEALQELLLDAPSASAIERQLFSDDTTTRVESAQIAAQSLLQSAGLQGVPSLLHHTENGIEVIDLEPFYRAPEKIQQHMASYER